MKNITGKQMSKIFFGIFSSLRYIIIEWYLVFTPVCLSTDLKAQGKPLGVIIPILCVRNTVWLPKGLVTVHGSISKSENTFWTRSHIQPIRQCNLPFACPWQVKPGWVNLAIHFPEIDGGFIHVSPVWCPLSWLWWDSWEHWQVLESL